jgi:hypothetical protein
LIKNFGCINCWSPEGNKAYKAVSSLPIEFHLIDKTIITVNIHACPCCSQRFIQITEDIVNWRDGDDATFRKFMPIIDKELDRLTSSITLDVRTIQSFGKDRQSLNYYWLPGIGPELYWNTGFGLIQFDSNQSSADDLLSYDFSL